MSWYCEVARGHHLHGPFHDTEHGFPVTDEAALFERLALEIMQAGLSWEIVLKKRPTLNAAFASFDVDAVAAFGEVDTARLLADPGIVRNRLKVAALIHNAQVIQGLRASHGGFHAWLLAHHPRRKADWIKLFKKTFKFTGGEIVGEFLMGTGFLPGAHGPDCPVADKVAAFDPPWQRVDAAFYLDR